MFAQLQSILPNRFPKKLYKGLSHQQSMRALVAPLPPHHLVFSLFLSHPRECAVVSYDNYNLHFLRVMKLTISPHGYSPLEYLFRVWSDCPSLLPICLLGFLFLIGLYMLLLCSGYKSFVRCMCCKYLLQSLVCLFTLSVFWWAEVLSFNEVKFGNLFFCE